MTQTAIFYNATTEAPTCSKSQVLVFPYLLHSLIFPVSSSNCLLCLLESLILSSLWNPFLIESRNQRGYRNADIQDKHHTIMLILKKWNQLQVIPQHYHTNPPNLGLSSLLKWGYIETCTQYMVVIERVESNLIDKLENHR